VVRTYNVHIICHRPTLIAIGYLDLKYLTPPYLKTQKTNFWGPIMLNQ